MLFKFSILICRNIKLTLEQTFQNDNKINEFALKKYESNKYGGDLNVF